MTLSNSFVPAMDPPHKPRSGVVAVVDDDQGIALALRTWLHHINVPVCTFSDGTAMAAAIQAVPGGWELRALVDAAADGGEGRPPSAAQPLMAVVMDLNMPGRNGFQIARQLREQAPDLPVVVITAASEDHQRLMGGAPPGVVCLSKPFDLDVLEAALFRDAAA